MDAQLRLFLVEGTGKTARKKTKEGGMEEIGKQTCIFSFYICTDVFPFLALFIFVLISSLSLRNPRFKNYRRRASFFFSFFWLKRDFRKRISVTIRIHTFF